jgi:hypothetical protein
MDNSLVDSLLNPIVAFISFSISRSSTKRVMRTGICREISRILFTPEYDLSFQSPRMPSGITTPGAAKFL